MQIWDKAVELHEAQQFAAAENLYDQLLAQNPANPGLLATLGTLYLQMNKYGLAIALFEAAMKYGKKKSDILCNLSVAYRRAGLMDKAKAAIEDSLKLDPQAKALANYAGFCLESESQEKGVQSLRKALEMEPDLAIAHWNLAMILLAQGKWETAWDEHEYGMQVDGMRANRGEVWGVPFWNGEPGQKVVVYGEQGIGDEIMFASMIPDLLKTNEVIIECHKRLVTLFQKAFPGVKCYGTREEREPQWPAQETAHARIAIGSLGKFYRRSRAAFPGTPYLKADPLPKGEKFRVGISWTGGMKASRVQKRTVPLSWWKSILNVPGVEFVSLQYTDAKEEIDLVNALGYDIKTMDDVVKAEDYYETARLVASCDLVISVCTSVIHLAGALGVPCWVMTPKYPAWRYQNEGGMPWYRSVRLYRAPEPGADAWKPVVERIGLDLDELVNAKSKLRLVA